MTTNESIETLKDFTRKSLNEKLGRGKMVDAECSIAILIMREEEEMLRVLIERYWLIVNRRGIAWMVNEIAKMGRDECRSME